ncbi:hypothetical protein [uncultured Nocardioides sp.]|uniref:hypothetical protein n=1 Tax=uncultured Nocardioides sp. TaxID=198441 RepID=UPI00261B602F|nr:hypothetical protein [uncultured Nocardioides sp.]
MNEQASPQRRRPPGWRAARPTPDEHDEHVGEDPAEQPGPAARPDTAFERGETVERPAVRLPVADQPDADVDADVDADDDADDDHPVFGARRDDDRTRTVRAVGPDLYADRPDGRAEAADDVDPDSWDGDSWDDDSWDGEDESSVAARPVAVPLTGFFTGMAYILGLPVLYVWLSDPDSIADSVGVDLAWLLAAILVPVFLTAIPQTRTFGRYMLLGVGLSAVVVVGVAAVVLAVLIFLV